LQHPAGWTKAAWCLGEAAAAEASLPVTELPG
jgi:hypothetical protein